MAVAPLGAPAVPPCADETAAAVVMTELIHQLQLQQEQARSSSSSSTGAAAAAAAAAGHDAYDLLPPHGCSLQSLPSDTPAPSDAALAACSPAPSLASLASLSVASGSSSSFFGQQQQQQQQVFELRGRSPLARSVQMPDGSLVLAAMRARRPRGQSPEDLRGKRPDGCPRSEGSALGATTSVTATSLTPLTLPPAADEALLLSPCGAAGDITPGAPGGNTVSGGNTNSGHAKADQHYHNSSSSSSNSGSSGSRGVANAESESAAAADSADGDSHRRLQQPSSSQLVEQPALAKQRDRERERQPLILIDFEYSGFAPVAFDIANHWCGAVSVLGCVGVFVWRPQLPM
jgi:Choline/ethanolamine kinase